MIDFIDITKTIHEDKSSPFFGHCKIEAHYPESGVTKYRLEGCERLDIFWSPNGILRLRGSIMYYWHGHNFTYSHEEFQSAINHIGRLLKVSLWDSIVNVFEFGVIMEVDTKPKEYIQHHKAKASEKLKQLVNEKDKGNFTAWADKNVSLKMYDAGRNILMKQNYKRREVIQSAGWNPELEYLKFEAHYLKPNVLKGQAVHLSDLINPDWQNVFREDLYYQYQRLVPMATIIEPTNKADLSTASIIAMALAEDSLNSSKTLEEVRKLLYARINSFPEGVLSKSDKDSRKRQIKSILDKMQEADTSKWDLSEKLADALLMEADSEDGSTH